MEVDSIITPEGVIGEEYQEKSDLRDKMSSFNFNILSNTFYL